MSDESLSKAVENFLDQLAHLIAEHLYERLRARTSCYENAGRAQAAHTPPHGSTDCGSARHIAKPCLYPGGSKTHSFHPPRLRDPHPGTSVARLAGTGGVRNGLREGEPQTIPANGTDPAHLDPGTSVRSHVTVRERRGKRSCDMVTFRRRYDLDGSVPGVGVHIDNRATLSGSPPASGRLPRCSSQADERALLIQRASGAAGCSVEIVGRARYRTHREQPQRALHRQPTWSGLWAERYPLSRRQRSPLHVALRVFRGILTRTRDAWIEHGP